MHASLFNWAPHVLIAATVAGCGGSGTTSDEKPRSRVASGACAPIIVYDGHTYRGSPVRVVAVARGRLGAATRPSCADTPGVPAGPDEQVEVEAIDGVRDEVAIVVRGQEGTVYVRDDVDLEAPPPALERLLRAPVCRTEDAPIMLSGLWQGILGPDGGTEVDLVPPYDVQLLTEEGSPSRYAGAYLSVRVPPGLGRPLDRKDIEESLWEGGTISVTARCEGMTLVATAVDASPPAG